MVNLEQIGKEINNYHEMLIELMAHEGKTRFQQAHCMYSKVGDLVSQLENLLKQSAPEDRRFIELYISGCQGIKSRLSTLFRQYEQ